jgi:hypothetical protein
MRPVGEPRGQYQPRTVGGAGPPAQLTSPVRLAPTDRWMADEFAKPGFSLETTKYTGPIGG